ncbi:hypothetical protein OE88DRAFT_1652211, partial [Heliocybe sulcata]
MYLQPPPTHGQTSSSTADAGEDVGIDRGVSPQRTAFVFTSSRAPVSPDAVVTLPSRNQPRLSYQQLRHHSRGAYDYKQTIPNLKNAMGGLPSGFIPLHPPSLLTPGQPFSTPSTPHGSTSFFDDNVIGIRDASLIQGVPPDPSPGVVQTSPSMPILPHRPRSLPFLPSSLLPMTFSSSSTLAKPDIKGSESEKRTESASVAADMVTQHASESSESGQSIEKWMAASNQKTVLHGRARAQSTVPRRPSPPSGPETERNLSLSELCESLHFGTPAKTGYQAAHFAPMLSTRNGGAAGSRAASRSEGGAPEKHRIKPEDT